MVTLDRYSLARGEKPEPVPATFDEALDRLAAIVNGSESGAKWLGMEEDKAVTQCHHGLGMYLRNEWGLWIPESPLRKDMERLGFTHPDDMSSALLLCAHRRLNHRRLEVEDQVAYYKRYWLVTNAILEP